MKHNRLTPELPRALSAAGQITKRLSRGETETGNLLPGGDCDH